MRPFAPFIAALLLAAAPAAAGPQSPAPAAHPVVVELFTSQSCSSCPPAEAYLGALAARPDVIALEWHVAYWNTLVAGSAGRWADPFSSQAHTARQAGYARALGNGGRVYTPQMVVDGRAEAVGSDRTTVEHLIEAARRRPGAASLTLAPGPAGGFLATAAGAPEGAGLWLVGFVDRRDTDVRGGENRGRHLVNHRIVTGIRRLGPAGGAPVAVARPVDADGCAVLVQDGAEGPILAAAACPAAAS